MSNDSIIRARLEAVRNEVDLAISLLKQSHGTDHAEVIEERIYNVLADLVTALSPAQGSTGEIRFH